MDINNLIVKHEMCVFVVVIYANLMMWVLPSVANEVMAWALIYGSQL